MEVGKLIEHIPGSSSLGGKLLPWVCLIATTESCRYNVAEPADLEGSMEVMT